MEDFFKQAFEYTFTFNNRVIDSLLAADALPDKSYKLINHTLNAHEIWNARIKDLKPTVGVWDIREISELKAVNLQNYTNSLSILEEFDLAMPIGYKTSKGDGFENTVLDIFFHIINHSTYHRGQIATNCKENGIEPLLSDYIFYKRNSI